MNDYDPNYKPEKLYSIVGQKAVILNYENKILLLRRSKKSSMSGMWSLAGGAIEKNEDALDGIKREIKEETRLNVDNLKPFYVRSYVSDKGDSVVIIAYSGLCSSNEVVLNWEHDKYIWVTKNEALAMELTKDARDIIKNFL